MRKEVPEGYGATAPDAMRRPNLSADSESGQQVADEQIEVKTPAVIEQHHAAAVVAITLVMLARSNTVIGATGGRFRVIGEMPDAVEGEDLAVEKGAKCRSWEGVVGDGAFQDGIGRREALSLI